MPICVLVFVVAINYYVFFQVQFFFEILFLSMGPDSVTANGCLTALPMLSFSNQNCLYLSIFQGQTQVFLTDAYQWTKLRPGKLETKYMPRVLSRCAHKNIYAVWVQSGKYLLLPAANLYDMMQKPNYLGFSNLAQKPDVLVVDLAPLEVCQYEGDDYNRKQ